ncbi:DUF4364 family protein [Parasporobacterium paucivorans]|uniref:DUF4364 domain-containing protein n=1 Tax=Parasporobacterium paucivorans DSM 15970 TaxID=1122934 RepID=A0A1M6KEC8_9FIRM|nr:DUF4364 family protein [Parasporobacterium paucivorans]SHJ57279.1 protein of unknown function [Parasporobacterium paucivorans DSM 15970]
MALDSLTLYKLIILYMLNKVDFPLTNSQVSEFFLEKGYTDYFTLQRALAGLLESGFISLENIRNTSYYHITPEGCDTLSFFGNKISTAIIDDVDIFLIENKYELRNEVGTVADYYKSTNQDYVVHCQVKEGKSTLIELNLSVPTKEQASYMCVNWKDASQEIYSHIMKSLMK